MQQIIDKEWREEMKNNQTNEEAVKMQNRLPRLLHKMMICLLLIQIDP
jgi:hypothetical protein